MSLNRRNALGPAFEKEQSPPLGRTVYFSKRRLLDRPWYCRYVVPEAYVYFVQLTVAAPSSHTWKCELTKASRPAEEFQKSKLSGKPRLWNPEVKNRQGANCLWNVNGLFIKGSSSICIYPFPQPPVFPEMCVQLEIELGEIQAQCDPGGFAIVLCFFSRPPFLGELSVTGGRNRFEL